MTPTGSAGTRKRTRTGQGQRYKNGLGALGYTFRSNEVTDQVEVFTSASGINKVEVLNPGLLSRIRSQMEDLGMMKYQSIDTAINALAYENQYNPVKWYLTHQQYDGGHYIADLAGCFLDTDGLFSIWIRKWLIGAIAKAVQGEQNRMLILDGNQGIGKSLFARWLCSGLPGYFAEGSIDPDSKDALLRLTSKWIWEVSEVGATMRKSDREALKNFISMQEVTVRRPYGVFDTHKPALASLIGTVNNEGGILNDPTGSRRFLICHIEKIDWAYVDLDVNLIWAEAYAAFLQGESHNLTPDEILLSEKNNEAYQVENPIEAALSEYYDIDAKQTSWFTPTWQIAQRLQNEGLRYSNSNALMKEIASTLKKVGLLKKRVGVAKTSGYEGIKVKI